MTRPAVTHLGLETTDVPRAARFYTTQFGLVPVSYTADRVAFDVGGTRLAVCRPTTPPRGGVHVHFAFTAPRVEWNRWTARFPDAHRVSFGDARSVYPFDPDGHCPEVACFGDDGTGLTGVFEVVLEVTDLSASERAYRALGFEPVDRGEERSRVRLRGPTDAARPFDLELWEPQLGLAGARGGVHVDLGIRVSDPAATARRAFGDHDRAQIVEPGGETTVFDTVETPDDDQPTDSVDNNGTTDSSTGSSPTDSVNDNGIADSPDAETSGVVRVRDPDGHHLRLVARGESA